MCGCVGGCVGGGFDLIELESLKRRGRLERSPLHQLLIERLARPLDARDALLESERTEIERWPLALGSQLENELLGLRLSRADVIRDHDLRLGGEHQREARHR